MLLWKKNYIKNWDLRPFLIRSHADLLAVLIVFSRTLPTLHKTNFLDWVRVVSVTLVWMYPKSFYIVFPLMGFYTFDYLPYVAMNYFILFIIAAIILCFSVNAFFKRSFAYLEQWPEELGPTFRGSLLIIYFFTFFSKLNSGFFDVTESCVTYSVKKIFKIFFEGDPISDIFIRPAILLTILIEAILIVLLFCKRTRLLGITVGFFFHLVLGMAGHFRISMTVYALYIFFLPKNLIRNIIEANYMRFFLVFLTAATIFYEIFAKDLIEDQYLAVASARENLALFLIFAAVSFFIYLPVFKAVTKNTFPQVNSRDFLVPKNRTLFVSFIAWSTYAIIIVNGIAPYLGLKNRSTFSMFSNLRTDDGKTNHFIVPDVLTKVFPFESDVVFVEQMSTNLTPSQYADTAQLKLYQITNATNYRVPLFELQRRAQDLIDHKIENQFAIKYHYKGQTFETSFLQDPLFVGTRHNIILNKLLAFEAVKGERCQP